MRWDFQDDRTVNPLKTHVQYVKEAGEFIQMEAGKACWSGRDIQSVAQCEEAAAALTGIAMEVDQVSMSINPYGCFFNDLGVLEFNTDVTNQNMDNEGSTSQMSICSRGTTATLMHTADTEECKAQCERYNSDLPVSPCKKYTFYEEDEMCKLHVNGSMLDYTMGGENRDQAISGEPNCGPVVNSENRRRMENLKTRLLNFGAEDENVLDSAE